MKKIIVVFLLNFILVGCSSNSVSSGKIACKDKDKIMKEEKVLLIDVRSSSEYESGHLDNAINIPYEEIGNKIGNYVVDKNTKIIVYCASGKRSNIAFDTLKNMGYLNIYDLGSINNCRG